MFGKKATIKELKMKRLHKRLKLKLMLIMFWGTVIFYITPLVHADGMTMSPGPAPAALSGVEKVRSTGPIKPTLAPPIADVKSTDPNSLSNIRLSRINFSQTDLEGISKQARAELLLPQPQPTAGKPVDNTGLFYAEPLYMAAPPVSDTGKNPMGSNPWEYLSLPTLADAAHRPHYTSGEIIVAFKSGVTESAVADLARNANSSVIRKLNLRKQNVHLFKVTGNQTEEDVINSLKQNPDVLYAERNAIFYTTGEKIPNDSYFSNQWALKQNTDKDIDAPEGWYELDNRFGRVGDPAITIAVIDTGIDWTHDDLAGPDIFTYPTQGNIWINATEWNGTDDVDDDGNGYVDDYFGYDFLNGDNNPWDDNGHGTHVAGIASAITNNNLGVAGVAWNCKIMPLKALNNLGQGDAADIAEAIDYAANNGAWVINMSFGGTENSSAIATAIQNAYAAGVVLVAAAGNDTVDLDTTKYYPACYDGVICVSATDKDDTYTSYTNYGSYVDVAAPGGKYLYSCGVVYSEQILSTYPGDSLAWMYGTSMACPHVAGLAALCFSKNPFITNQDVMDYITDGADDLGSAGKDDYYGYGRINVYGTINRVPVIIYVDKDAPGNDDGSSWTNAYNKLQDAFDDASSGDQIFVAAGTYYPDEGDSVTNNDRSETFQLISGVAVRGAFAGYGTANPYYRNTTTYTTTLSGDIDKDSVLDSDNSRHVVKGVDGATLEAFTITKGYADGSYASGEDEGAGMLNISDSPMVTYCTFTGNYAGFGAGMMNTMSSSPTIIDCAFISNTVDPHLHTTEDSGSGGGMCNGYGSYPTIIGCFFNDNSALCAGGLFDCMVSGSTISNSIFYANRAEGSRSGFTTSGGGMATHSHSDDDTPILTNCLFIANTAAIDGGGLYTSENSDVTLTNCTFSYNDADDDGGGICFSDNLTITNCILWGNSDSSGTTQIAQICDKGATLDIDYSCVQGWNGYFGGTGNIGSASSPFTADGYHLNSSSPCIDVGDSSKNYSGQTDIDGDNRVIDISGKGDGNNDVDMGVDEYHS
jgi:predicted outer membrane repeat protein